MSEGALLIVDATGHVLGRLASIIAKRLLEGYRVVVLNAEKALLSGRKQALLREMGEWLNVRSAINPRHTPRHPRTPDGIITYAVRGMLPRRRPKGLSALKRLRVYVDEPPSYKGLKAIRLEEALAKGHPSRYVSLGELAKEIGWQGATAWP